MRPTTSPEGVEIVQYDAPGRVTRRGVHNSTFSKAPDRSASGH